ncbi:MAG TPA: KTSC domain-containing protein [Sphingomicrobium sp.]|nr:KTSC domain-containing protein [Sphingomicrobium sp.]
MRCRLMPSTVIRRFAYAPARRELTVEFTTGRRYRYLEVPEDEAEALASAFAKGVHFNRRIRGRFAFRELDPVGIEAQGDDG